MSSTLMWRPIVDEGEALPDKLKWTISRKLWDTDGSCGGGEAVVTIADVPYLEGLQHAGVRGAEELIGHVRKYGAVALWLEH